MKKKPVVAYNIEPVAIDIKRPDYNYRWSLKFQTLDLRNIPRAPKIRKRYVWKIIFGTVACAVIVLGITASILITQVRAVKSTFLLGGFAVADNLSYSVSALKDFEPQRAVASLQKNTQEIDKLNVVFESGSRGMLFAALGNFVPAVKDIGGLLKQISSFNLNFLKLAESLSDLQLNGFQYFQNDGVSLIAELTKTQNLMRTILSQSITIRNTTSRLKTFSPLFNRIDSSLSDQYIRYGADLRQWDVFLTNLIRMLDAPDGRRFAILFQNPAEIRPAGGFIGSFGDISINGGQMINLDVQDIYWPDHPMNLSLKVIPPQPLQAITHDWGARDANWFFDFPTSAKTVLSFLEASKIYQENNITFDGVIGLNINVLKTILELTQPVRIAEYEMTIDSNNFLIELQREVETGRDKKPGQNPKRILSVLTPIIFERLGNITDDDKKMFIEKLGDHIGKKDIMFFSKDSDIMSMLKTLEIDGSVYLLPLDFWGTYLAVVNANIAGGKSDAFIEQSIDVIVDVDTGGSSFVNTTVTRMHTGGKEKDPWWRAANKDFIQIFTNDGASFISMSGNDPKRELPKEEYTSEYMRNADVEAIEKTRTALDGVNGWMMRAFDKTVFSTWLETRAGKTTAFNAQYQTPPPLTASLTEGKKYQFIFERQSGVRSNLTIKINSPLGYAWEESKNSVFVYEADDPEKRIIFNLTLFKI